MILKVEVDSESYVMSTPVPVGIGLTGYKDSEKFRITRKRRQKNGTYQKKVVLQKHLSLIVGKRLVVRLYQTASSFSSSGVLLAAGKSFATSASMRLKGSESM